MPDLSEKERQIQRALGLLRWWIITLYDPRKIYRYPDTISYRFDQHEYCIVEAYNLKHAQQQVKECGGYFASWAAGGWQSNERAKAYRAQVIEQRGNLKYSSIKVVLYL